MIILPPRRIWTSSNESVRKITKKVANGFLNTIPGQKLDFWGNISNFFYRQTAIGKPASFMIPSLSLPQNSVTFPGLQRLFIYPVSSKIHLDGRTVSYWQRKCVFSDIKIYDSRGCVCVMGQVKAALLHDGTSLFHLQSRLWSISGKVRQLLCVHCTTSLPANNHRHIGHEPT